MATRLSKPLRREVDIEGALYTVTIAPEGLKIVEKGKRKGQELTWRQLLGGASASAPELQGSMSLGAENDESRG